MGFKKYTALILAATICLSFSSQQLPVSAASAQVVDKNNEGVNALKTGNYSAAVAAFIACLKLDPSYKLARENLAICFNNWGIQLQNNPKAAIEKFHKSLFYSPANSTAVQNLEVTIQNMGKDPKSFKDRVELGKQARLSGDMEGGIIEYAEALNIKDDPALRVELGNLYYVRERVDDAITQYNIASKAPNLDPETRAKVFRSLGQAYQAKKDFPQAASAYNQAITLNRTDKETLEANKALWIETVSKDPTNPLNHVGLGQAYMYLGDFDQAQAELATALTFDRNCRPAMELKSRIPIAKLEFERDKHVNSGVDLQTRKLFDPAIQEYQRALGQDSQLPAPNQIAADIMLNLGSAYQAKEDYNTAISWYSKALSKKPDLAEAQEGLKVSKDRLAAKQLDESITNAGTAFKSGQYQQALTLYQQILSAKPKDPAAHFNVAACLQALKQIDAAIAEYKQASSLDPKNAQYKDALTKAIQDKADPIIDTAVKKHSEKDYTTAIDLYQKALAIVPDNREVMFNLAACYYSRQQFPDAQKLYEQLYQLDSKKYVDDLWLIGTILENSKRGSDALAKYTQYVTQAPTGTYAAQAKARMEALRKDPNDCIKIKSESEIAQDKAADDAYKAGVAAQQAKNYDEAYNQYMKAMQIHTKDPAIPFALGTLFQQKSDYDSAMKWFQMAIDLAAADPKFDKKTVEEFKQALKAAKDDKAKPIVDDAIKKQTAGDLVSAIDLYNKALSIVPDNADIYTALGKAYQLTDDFAKAYEAYKKAMDLNSGKRDTENYYLMAIIDENFARGTVAITNYRKYISAQPAGPYVKKANERLAALTKDATKTQKLPTQGEIKANKLADDEFNKGLELQKGGNPQEAIGHYQKAAAVKPDESAFFEAIATCYQQLKQYDQAIASYDQAIALASKANRNKDVDSYRKEKQTCAEEKAGPIVDQALEAYNSGDFCKAADLYLQVIQIVPSVANMHTSRAASAQACDNFAVALEEYQKAYELDPKSEGDNLYLIAVLKEHFGKGPDALSTYRKYLTERPAGKYASLARQRVDQLAKDVSKTAKIPTSSERKSQEQVQGLYTEAVAAYNKADYAGCAEKMEQLLKIPGVNDAVYHYQLGAAYLGMKNFDGAKAEFSSAQKLEPANKQYKDALESCRQLQLAPLVDEAVKKQTAGDLQGAIDLYRQALQLDSNNASVHTNLASALNAAEDFQGARDEFQKGYNLDRKGQVGNMYFMGILDENSGKGTLALQEYKQYALEAGATGPYSADAQARVKRLTANPNDLQKIATKAELAKSQELTQDYQDGIAAQQAGNFDLAIEKYSKVVNATPNEAAYNYALATAYDNKGDLDNAIVWYEKAIQLNGGKEKSWKEYLKSARQRKAAPFVEDAINKQTGKSGAVDVPGAIISYENALKLDDDPNTRLNLGTAYQGSTPPNLPKALENYKRSVQLDPKLVDAYYYMGTVYEGMNQPQQAIQQYKLYLQKAPTGPNAAAVKERLKILGVPVK